MARWTDDSFSDELENMSEMAPKCEHPGCTEKPLFYHILGNKSKFCSQHILNAPIQKKPKCQVLKCKEPFTQTISGQTFCSRHALAYLFKPKNCEIFDCNQKARFTNDICKKQGNFCFFHKESGMIDVQELCVQQGCCKPSTHCFPTREKKPRKYLCADHAYPQMVSYKKKDDVIDNRIEEESDILAAKNCEAAGCDLPPAFNWDGEDPKWCEAHRLPHMRNVACKEEACHLRAEFNWEGQRVAKYCFQHKRAQMLIVFTKPELPWCESERCKKRAKFNFEGEVVARLCSNHRLQGMVNVANAQCSSKYCDRVANYNYKGELQKRLWCCRHKKENMVHWLQQTTDAVETMKNDSEPCNKKPRFWI